LVFIGFALFSLSAFQADLLMSVDRGRPEVSAIRSNRREQPKSDILC
jgi:hypothetical protein